MTMHFPLPTRRATTRLGRALARRLQPGDLVVFEGPLGAGKTFMIRALCRGLGWPETERVTSPTFTLVQEYPSATHPIAHADLYRLAGADDVLALGLDARRRDGAIVLVEWGGDYVGELGGDGVVVRLAREPRAAALRATGPRSEAILRALAEAQPLLSRRVHSRY